MVVPKIVLALSISAGALFTFSGAAQAFSFVTNDFDANPLSKSDAKNDIWLNSVSVLDDNGKIAEIISDFSFVSAARIVANDQYTGGNTGAASADRGDNTTTGVNQEAATAADIVANLGNNNLNNIIDTEDSGSFKIDLSFDKVMDNLLIWERGNGAGNSDLAIQALDQDGNLIGNYLKITRNMWQSAGFYIDTLEIGGAQEVGSLGVNIAKDLGVEGGISSVRFFSESGFNGPDWKFVGTNASRNETTDVPEPTLALGLSLLGGLLMAQKRMRTA